METFGVGVELSSVFQLSEGAQRRGAKLKVQLASSEFEHRVGELHHLLRHNSTYDVAIQKCRGASWVSALYKDFADAGTVGSSKTPTKQRLVLINDMNMHPILRHRTYQQLLSKYASERNGDGPTIGEQMRTKAERRVLVAHNFDSLGFEVEMGTWCEPFTSDEIEAAFDFTHGPGFGTVRSAGEMDAYVQLYQLCDGCPHPSEPSMVTRKTGVDLEWVEKGLLVALADEGSTLRSGYIWHPIKSCPRDPKNPVKMLAELDGESKRRRVYFAPLDLVFRSTVAGFPESYSPGYKRGGDKRNEVSFLFSYAVGADEVRLVEGKVSVVDSMAWNMCSAMSIGCINNILLVNETFRSLGSFDHEGYRIANPSKEGAASLDDLIRNELWMVDLYKRNVAHKFR